MSKNNFKINVHDTLLGYFQKKMMVLIYPTNNKNFLKTRLLRFAMYVIVNLTELNLFLFIYFTYFTLFL